MSRTIEAIMRHTAPPQRSAPRTDPKPASNVAKDCERGLVAEWQTGVEILGHAQRKLRLAFACAPSSILAAAGH